MTRRLWMTAIALALAGLAGPGPALAQKTTIAPDIVKPSKKPAHIGRQLRLAGEEGRMALMGLRSAVPDDKLPMDEETLQHARNTYVLVRAARVGLDNIKNDARSPDPLIELAYSRVTHAWNLSRTPVDQITWGISRRRYLEVSVRDLSAALRLIDQVGYMLP